MSTTAPPFRTDDDTAGAGIEIAAPLKGWLLPIDAVPDPVFAQRMLGDGVAIDPVEGCLYAPCAGEVAALQPTGHAITLRAGDGVEILMHIGIDTVGLGGAGFEPCVQIGDQVDTGTPLIRFDLDAVVRGAPSVVTPVLLLTGDGRHIRDIAASGPVAPGTPIFRVVPDADTPGQASPALAGDGAIVRRSVQVPLAHGLHARPAARLSDAIKLLQADVRIHKGERSASVRSTVGVMTLGVAFGDTIELEGQGADAAKAVERLAALIESGMDERTGAAPPSRARTAPAPPVSSEPGLLSGVCAAPGLALGKARHYRLPDIAFDPLGRGETIEQARLDQGLTRVVATIEAELRHAAGPHRAILDAHRTMLGDPELRAEAMQEIAHGASASRAWRDTLRPRAAMLRASGDAHLAERADDMADLERRVIAAIEGVADTPPSFPPDTILIADDLLPSQVMALDTATVRGFCTVRGGPTSHVAILAGSLGIPALVAMGPALRAIAEEELLILDATAGTLRVAPSDAHRHEAEARVAARAAALAAARAAAGTLCHMADGTRIEVFTNCGSAADAARGIANGAEGCGLLRTEFLFLERETAPDVEEQTAAYQAVADALQGKPLIIRLLDIGGDKPAPYLPIPVEENPALGLRGIRVGFANPQLLEDQIRAILGVRPLGQARIMIPMVASLEELRRVRAVVERIAGELGITEPTALGIMVETPAAAATADLLAAEADFLSIGTNDLTQYALAMDRGNPSVAPAIDGLHPAVLRLIAQTCEGGAMQGRWTGVCGGLASDPLAVPILVGLGVTELSATTAMVPEVKALVAGLTMERARAHARAALACPTAADVRRLAREFNA